MNNNKRARMILNVMFVDGKVICAKSPELCKGCRIKDCETMELYYYPYDNLKDIMKERSYKRVNGALRQK